MLDSSSGGLRWAELLRFAVLALGACGVLVRALWHLPRICTVWWYPSDDARVFGFYSSCLCST